MFNFDETALLYGLPPSKNLFTVRNIGKKSVKSRVTVAMCCNASGSEKLGSMIIRKFKKPRCFKGVEIEKRGIVYAENSKAWMTEIIFDKWLHQLNLRIHGRKFCYFSITLPATRSKDNLTTSLWYFSFLTWLLPFSRSMHVRTNIINYRWASLIYVNSLT